MRASAFALAACLFVGRDASAQRIVLELRPRAGDTLRMQLDQTTEMSGGRQGRTPKEMSTTIRMYSRAIVERNEPGSTLILAITDSANATTNDERNKQLLEEMKRQLVRREMRFNLAPDGTVAIADQVGSVSREMSEMVAVMPASFPRGSVAVGDTWLREMPFPASTQLGVPLGGTVKAAFRLDSIAGDIAYLSMRGNIRQSIDSVARNDNVMSGTVAGSMIVDRRRGWLSESRFMVQMRAVVASPSTGLAIAPMEFRVRISQHMRVTPARRP